MIWVKECVDDKVRDATFLEGVAGVLDYEEVFEKTVKEFCVCLIRHLSKSRDTHITGHGCGGILREEDGEQPRRSVGRRQGCWLGVQWPWG